jgi:hypothetical protein
MKLSMQQTKRQSQMLPYSVVILNKSTNFECALRRQRLNTIIMIYSRTDNGVLFTSRETEKRREEHETNAAPSPADPHHNHIFKSFFLTTYDIR